MRIPPALFAAFLVFLAAPLYAGAGAGTDGFVSADPAQGLVPAARYGPFRVIAPSRAVLAGVTDEDSPAQFAAMLRDFPGLAVLEMVECPGTFDDRANLRLGRMIRAAGLVTHVPRGGSVRSGAVELFLAGASRVIDDGAEFAVHAWEDDSGMEAGEYAADAPENMKYLVYYREMGMDTAQAASFYAMTNSVPYDQARWLDANEMRRWLGMPRSPAGDAPVPPRLSYLDLSRALH